MSFSVLLLVSLPIFSNSLIVTLLLFKGGLIKIFFQFIDLIISGMGNSIYAVAYVRLSIFCDKSRDMIHGLTIA